MAKRKENNAQPEAQDRVAEQLTEKKEAPPSDFCIVGVGASAGGLEAMSSLFGAMPEKTGNAYVVIQHLDPTHPSTLHELLKRYTKMTVLEARNDVRVEPDHVYIIPPTKNIFYADGYLQLKELDRKPGEAHTIDIFFKSLAEQLHDKATCIILSGTGSDGLSGAKAIKAELGMVIAQAPETARYDGMPKTIISAGLADYILSPDKILSRLNQIIRESREQTIPERESGLL